MQWDSIFADMCGCVDAAGEGGMSEEDATSSMFRRESLREHLEDVTIVDMETGTIKPSKRMQFAAACTLSGHGGIVPEADPSLLHHLCERMTGHRDALTLNIKPPIPARYRFHLFSQLSEAIPAASAHVLYPPVKGMGMLSLLKACELTLI